ncbi:vascular endothelial growth factor A isoform X2 [Varanus komodoensis]|uniref:vascular endothelial growth factor A isoform X2 n=1 Tax=Varanus komodoensis TaxID=61221 RepID=UPI001CF79B4D|nr:vascular endothelial growth factor A isoform X2 [Varanus komodoensis]
MNFLLTWIHWGLAALLYLHHAKLSQAAPSPGDVEKRQSDVMSFMEVFARSTCKPIETMVDIYQEYPEDVEHIFKPSCVLLMRCAGCCNDESLECTPTEVESVSMEIMKIRQLQSQGVTQMTFQQHTRCECRPKKDIRTTQENHCEPCSERRKHLYKQDPQTCKCSCKFTDSRCKSRQLELNERTCRCDRPRR